MQMTKLEIRDKQICLLSIILEVANGRDKLWKTVRLACAAGGTPKEVTHLQYQTILNNGTRLTFALTFQQVGLFLDNYSKNILGIVVDKRDYHNDSGKLPYYYSRGWHLGIFGVGMCRPGHQIGTPF